MQRCPNCSRHVWQKECRCPFCAASLCYVQGSAPVVISTLVGLAMFGCMGDPGETTAATTGGSTSVSSTGTDSASSTSDISTTSTSDLTSGSGSASDSTSTSTTTMTPTTSDPTSGSTSDATSTSTSTSTSSTSDSSTSQTSGTTDDTDSGTTQTSTGGDCTGRGEEICGGVCVNTLEDEDHCGKCFNVCEGSICEEGECMVILPYGAPMPEPRWV